MLHSVSRSPVSHVLMAIKRVCALPVLFALALLSTSGSASAIAQSPGSALQTPSSGEASQATVRVAPVTPYTQIDAQGRWSGPAIDLMHAAAARADMDIVFVEAVPGNLAQLEDATAALPVFAHPEQLVGKARSLPIARDSIGLLGAGGSGPFLSKMLGLFNWGFAKVALVLTGILLVIGTVFWLAERGRNEGIDGEAGGNGPLGGIGNGFWWAGVTATTIGYGDTVPKTLAGRTVAMVWMLVSMALTALLTAYLVSLAGGGMPYRELAKEIEGKRVAVVGELDGADASPIPDHLLAAAAAVQSYPTLDAARAALDAEQVDLVAHPYRALQSRTMGTGITRTNAEMLMPVVMVDEASPALRREIDRIVLTIDWQQRLGEDR